MTYYYVDNEVGGPGTGTLLDPWDDIASNIDTLAASDTMFIMGNAVVTPRIYNEPEILCAANGTQADPIVIRPYASDMVTIKNTMESSSRTLTIAADWWEIYDLGFDNEFTGGGGSMQILLDGANHILIQDCTLTQNPGDGAIFFHADNGATYVTIEGCGIHDTYKGDTSDSAGILIGAGDYITISDCTIYDCRGDCVTADEDWGTGTVGNITVQDCHLYTTLGKCSENACDLKDGTLIVRRNEMHGFRYCDSTCGGSGGGIGDAVTIHSQATTAQVYENVIYDCVSGISIGCPGSIHHNLVRDLVTDAAAWLNTAINPHGNADDVDIYDNTFVECPEHVLYFSSGVTCDLKNNLFYETHDIYVDGAATVTYDYNGWFNVGDSLVGAHDTTGSGDPGFRDAAGDDYELMGNSVCVDAGVDVGLPYHRAAPDLGYDEYARRSVICMII